MHDNHSTRKSTSHVEPRGNSFGRLTATLALVAAFATTAPASTAFSTYKWFGGAVHRSIIKEALKDKGLSKQALEEICNGCDAQDDPGGKNFSVSQYHACDNKIAETRQFLEQVLNQCAEQAKTCENSAAARRNIRRRLGEGLHALQDFYSHSNYLESLLSAQKPLVPVDWSKPLAADISTCYYHYESFLKQEYFERRSRAVFKLMQGDSRLKFHSQKEYQARLGKDLTEKQVLDYAMEPVAFTHVELNKDNAKTIEGKVISQEHRKSYHQLARDLAAADTALYFSRFEELLRQVTMEKADKILTLLKVEDKS
ncbi:MAG: hypothetical protein HY986_01315 [Candidatus Melainabacteria bacterium]|nr:hypothetical protein [Candidatus Melainabacteria bacterium]